MMNNNNIYHNIQTDTDIYVFIFLNEGYIMAAQKKSNSVCGGRGKETGEGMRKKTLEQSLESIGVDHEDQVGKINQSRENSILKLRNS